MHAAAGLLRRERCRDHLRLHQVWVPADHHPQGVLAAAECADHGGSNDGFRLSHARRSVDIPPLVLDPDAKKPEAANVQVFAGAPAHVMAGALQHLRQQYGGVASYLESVCGFSRVEQALLQQHLKPA